MGVTDTMTCENSTVTNEIGYHGEGENLNGMDEEEQEGSLIPQVETMRIQEDQKRNKDHKHKEKMLGDPAGITNEEPVMCKGLFPEGYQMSVTCGGFTKVLRAQDAHNTHTLMDPEVFISGLIAMNKAPQDLSLIHI